MWQSSDEHFPELSINFLAHLETVKSHLCKCLQFLLVFLDSILRLYLSFRLILAVFNHKEP